MSSAVQTKFGNVSMHKGYLVITSRAEGNYGKSLHRLIFEDFYQCDLNEEFPEGVIIHHEDGNKLNNEIWNLVPMCRGEHAILHRNPEEIIILDYINPNVRTELNNTDNVLVAEVAGSGIKINFNCPVKHLDKLDLSQYNIQTQ